jgi:hypothetical protein
MDGSAEWMERVAGTCLLGMAQRHTTGSVVLVTIRSALEDNPRQQGLGLFRLAASEWGLPLAP